MYATIDALALPTGLRLPYVEQGDPGGVPVLLLHGYGDSWRSFEPVLRHLSPDVRAIAPTQRGHGEADRPAGGYATRDFAADAVALLDALGVESAVVAGHAMGAAVAQRMALDHPDRVSGLVLSAAATTWVGNPAIAELARDVAALADPVDEDFVRAFQAGTAAEPLDDDLLESVVAESVKVPAHVWQATMRDTVLDDFSAELGSISARTLVVWGDQDAEVSPREQQEALVRALPRAWFAIYRGIGHAVHWESPARFAVDVEEFAQAD